MYIGLAAILLHVVIMSVSTFKTVVILYICIYLLSSVDMKNHNLLLCDHNIMGLYNYTDATLTNP